MNDILKLGSDQQRELFDRFRRQANGFSSEDVIGAAINLLVNGIRQSHATAAKAEASFDEKFTKAKTLLLRRYDSNGQRVRVTPLTQILQVPHISDKDRF